MKPIVKALYNQPVIFLAVVQAAATAAAVAKLVSAVVPVVTLPIVTALQRSFVRPAKRRR